MNQTEQDALGEILNIGVGRAAASLSDMLATRVALRVPRVRVCTFAEIGEWSPAGSVSTTVKQTFRGAIDSWALAGDALLVFPTESGKKLAALLGGFDPADELSELELSGILSEVGNIVLNAVLGSMANIAGTQFDYSIPDFYLERGLQDILDNVDAIDASTTLLIADAEFQIESRNICGSVVIALDMGSIDCLFGKVLSQVTAGA